MMINAIIAVHLENGAWAQNNGFEYPLVLAVVAAAIAVAGAGAYSLDAELGWHLSGVWGAAGIAAGVVAGLVSATVRRIETAPAAAAEDTSRRAA
jgi:putative oxidoreductase